MLFRSACRVRDMQRLQWGDIELRCLRGGMGAASVGDESKKIRVTTINFNKKSDARLTNKNALSLQSWGSKDLPFGPRLLPLSLELSDNC